MFSRFGNNTNDECMAWVNADQYSTPGGSLPVTETAYTPGLKLPVINKGKHIHFSALVSFKLMSNHTMKKEGRILMLRW